MQSTAPLQVLNRKDRVGKRETAEKEGDKKVKDGRGWYKPAGYSADVEAKRKEQARARARAEREQRVAARLQSHPRELTVPSQPSRSKREPTHSEVAAHNAVNTSANEQVQARNRHLYPRPRHLQFPAFAQPHRSASEDHPYRQVDAHRVGYSYSESHAHTHAPLDSSRHRSLSANAQYAPFEEEFPQAPALHPYLHPNGEIRPDVVASRPAHKRAPSTTVTATTEPSRYSQSSWGGSTFIAPLDFSFATGVRSEGGGVDVEEKDGSCSGLGSGVAMDGVSLDSGDSSAIYSRPINPTSVATVTRQRARIRKGLRLDKERRDGSRSSGGDGQEPGAQRVKKKRERSLPPLPPPKRPSLSQVFSPPLDLESRPTTSEPAPQHSLTSGMTAHANPVHKPPRPPRPPADASLADYVDLHHDVVRSKPGPSKGVSATHQTKPKGPRGVMSGSSRTGQSLRKDGFVPPTPMKNLSPLSEVAAYPDPERDVGDGQQKMEEDERIVTLHGRLISGPMPLDRASSQTKGSPGSGPSSSSSSKSSASKLAPARPSNVHPKANLKGTPTPPRSYLRNNTGGVQDQRGERLTYQWTSPSVKADPRSGSGSAPHKESSTSPSSPHYHKSSHSSRAVPPTSHSASSSTSSSSHSHSTSHSTMTVATEATTTSAFHSARNVFPSAQSFTSLVRKAWRKVSFFSNSKKVHESQSADYVLWPATTMPVRQELGGGAPSGAPITPIRLAVGGAVTRERSWSGGWGRMG